MTTKKPKPSSFQLQSSNKTLDNLPSNSILVHSTNCFGTWGSGVALAIAERHPAAENVYEEHCQKFCPTPDAWPKKEGLVGSCLLIPPTQGEGKGVWIACLFTSYGYGRPSKKKAGKDSKGKIVQQTRAALVDLRQQLKKLQGEEGPFEEAKNGNETKDGEDVEGSKKKRRSGQLDSNTDIQIEEKQDKGSGDNDTAGSGPVNDGPAATIYSPTFNGGSFGVRWEETESLVQEVFADWDGLWFLLAPP